MSQCKDIDTALANLNRKINEQNRRIKELETSQKQCCNDKKNNNKPQDLSDIYQRLSRIEGYINALDQTGNELKRGIQQIKNIFLGET